MTTIYQYTTTLQYRRLLESEAVLDRRGGSSGLLPSERQYKGDRT